MVFQVVVPSALILLVAAFGWLNASRAAQRRLGKLAEGIGLAVDGDVAPVVEARLRRRQRGMMLGMAVGGVVGGIVVYASGGLPSALGWWVAAELGGTGAGALLVHVVDSRRASAEPGPRAAVLRPRRLHDFLYPAETAAPLVALVLPALAGALALTSTASGAQAPGLVVGSCAAVAFTVAAVAAQRYVLRLSPPAASPVRVKWEDAVRGLALRDLGVTGFGASFALGAVAAYNAATALIVGYSQAVLVATYVAVGLGVLTLAALVLVAESSQTPARRFLRLYGGQG